MNIDDSPDEAAFRAAAKVWLLANAPEFRIPPDATEADAHDIGRVWQARKARAGYVGFTLPTAFGGRGGTIIEQLIFQGEEARHHVPQFNSFILGWGVVLPVLAQHGTPEQFQLFGPPTLSGEMVWCQLFSEPAGGSDIAALRTRAERDGDHWIVNGQKVWTSDAHLSDWGILLARTNPAVSKHKGLTMFLLDMRSAGVEIRPITKINGDAEFNEVFFTDVRISDAHRLGEVDGGWKVAHTTFSAEHEAFGAAASVVHNLFEPLRRLSGRITDARGAPRSESPDVRAFLADYYATYSAVEHLRLRQNSALSKGGHLGFESAISKLVLARLMQQAAAFGLDIAGPAALAVAVDEDPDLREIRDAYLAAPGLRIGGGTDEVALNNIAERILGMPADPRPDRDTPFSQLKV